MRKILQIKTIGNIQFGFTTGAILKKEDLWMVFLGTWRKHSTGCLVG